MRRGKVGGLRRAAAATMMAAILAATLGWSLAAATTLVPAWDCGSRATASTHNTAYVSIIKMATVNTSGVGAVRVGVDTGIAGFPTRRGRAAGATALVEVYTPSANEHSVTFAYTYRGMSHLQTIGGFVRHDL